MLPRSPLPEWVRCPQGEFARLAFRLRWRRYLYALFATGGTLAASAVVVAGIQLGLPQFKHSGTRPAAHAHGVHSTSESGCSTCTTCAE